MKSIAVRGARFAYRKTKLIKLKLQYRRIIRHMQNKNVMITDERTFYKSLRPGKQPKGPVIILRHDVDRSLRKIKKIGKIESKFGVRSTLHLRVKERTYKLKDLNKLDLKNFDVALHLETNDANEMKKDKKTLEKMTGRKIIGASIHGGYYPGKNISKKRILKNLKKAGFKYITFYNKGRYPVKEFGIILIPYLISDLEIVQSGYKMFMKELDDIIRKEACSSLNTHPEYF